MVEEDKDLVDFSWDEGNSDWFNIGAQPEEVPVPAEQPKEAVKEEEQAPPEKPEQVQEEQLSEDDFFKEVDAYNEKVNTESEEQEEVPPSGDNFWNGVYQDFKEKGLLKHIELEEGEEPDAEKIFELQQEDYEIEVSERLKGWANELDEDGKAFILFKEQGGNTRDFFKLYQSSTEIPTGSIEDEAYQDALIRYQMKQEEVFTPDEIEERLQFLTESGKKEAYATKYDKKVKQQEAQERERLLLEAETQKEAAKQQKLTFKQEIKSTLDEIDEVKGLKITKQDKTRLYNLMTKEQYKVGNKSITGLQKLMGEIFQDKEKLILLAKLADTDFDMSSIQQKERTKQTREVKSHMEQRANLRSTNSGSSLGGFRGLADLIEK